MKKPGMAAYPEVSSVIALHGIFTGAFLGFIGDHHAGIHMENRKPALAVLFL